MRVLIVGCGYVGSKVGAELVRQGHEVLAVCRTPSSQLRLQTSGFVTLAADLTVVESCAALPRDCDWVVLCVSSKGGDVADYERTYLQGARNLVELLSSAPPAKLVYTSSTSVYGQDDGSIVDESSATQPTSPTAQVLLRTEQFLFNASAESRVPAVVLRIAGIYGPGRTHWIERLKTGLGELDLRSGRIMNLIHRDDVAGAILAALERGRPGEIYNVVDDAPVPQAEFIEWLCARLGQPVSVVGGSAPGRAVRRTATSKRVSNRKLKEQLGYRLQFPTFREGYLAAGE